MQRISISYRREDSQQITGRIYDRLTAYFGRDVVFRDIDNYDHGDFRKLIHQAMVKSDIILAVVGSKWIGPTARQSRLANVADPVRLEIETALHLNKPLIPLLVSPTKMPRPEQLPESLHDFPYQNAISIDPGQDFDSNVARVIRTIDRILSGRIDQPPTLPEAFDEKPTSADELNDLRETNRELEARIAEIAEEREAESANASRAREEASAALLRNEQEITELSGQLSAAQEEAINSNKSRDETSRALSQSEQRAKDLGSQLAATRQAAAAGQQKNENDLTATQQSLEQSERRNQALTAELAAVRASNGSDHLKYYRIAVVALAVVLVAALVGLAIDRQRPVLDQAALTDQINAARAPLEAKLRTQDVQIADLNKKLADAQTQINQATAARDTALARIKELQAQPAQPSLLQDPLARGNEAYTRTDYAEAMKWYLVAANQGNAEAQKNIGLMYDMGLGVVQDYGQAMIWYRRAADQGNAQAQNDIGTLYLKGTGVPVDWAQALTWFQKAADQDNPLAQNSIGYIYKKGLNGVEQDYLKAMYWFRKSASHNNSTAQFNIGSLYENGYGVDADIQQARGWYDLAARQGNNDARNALARLDGTSH